MCWHGRCPVWSARRDTIACVSTKPGLHFGPRRGGTAHRPGRQPVVRAARTSPVREDVPVNRPGRAKCRPTNSPSCSACLCSPTNGSSSWNPRPRPGKTLALIAAAAADLPLGTVLVVVHSGGAGQGTGDPATRPGSADPRVRQDHQGSRAGDLRPRRIPRSEGQGRR